MKKVRNCKGKIGAGIAAVVLSGCLFSQNPMDVYAAGGLDMSTDYPGITVKAGESVSFDLDFSTAKGENCDAALSIVSIPEEWEGYFQGNNGQISKVHVDGDAVDGGQDLATFKLSLPDEAKEGTYHVVLKADGGDGNTDTLDLEIAVNEKVTGQGTFTSEYPEQQGATGTSFSFDMTIANNRAAEQSYSLSAEAESGWSVSFTPSGESTQVASMTVDAGSSQDLTIDIVPPENIEKGEYTIPCTAASATETLTTELKVIITGTYDVKLSTKSENLNVDAYANTEKAITLTVTNEGNVDLENLELTSSAPSNWEVRFEESTIETLEAGGSKEVTAYIKPDSDALTGDYMATISISNDETSSDVELRVSVKTHTVWGVFAVAVIIALLAGLNFIFKKYGRR
ncbi:MAG: NEW3 domain-containing protein [Oliverpabstia sp.]